MCREEHLLQQILGFEPTDEPARETEQTRCVRAIQVVERAGYTRAAALGEGQIRAHDRLQTATGARDDTRRIIEFQAIFFNC